MSYANYFDYDGQGEATGDFPVFLAGWDDADWEKLLAHTTSQRFAPGGHLRTIGARDRSLHILASGTVEVLVGDDPTKDRINTVREGSVIGEVGFLDGGPASAHAVAKDEVLTLRLSFEQFEAFAADHPRLGRDVLLSLGAIVAHRLRRLTPAPRA